MTTIKDIAKVAGVSITTVSRALNGYSDVNEKTRKKIMQVAKDLNYSPNTLARSLVMNKSKTIGLIVSGMTEANKKDNFTFEVLSGANDCISERDYDLVLFSTTTAKQREKTYSQLCRERRVDGAIVQGMKIDDPYLKEVIESDIPCVLIDIPIESDTVGYVTTDNVLGARKAVRHLIELGHKNIAMINGHNQAYVSIKRLEGYEKSLQEEGFPVNQSWILDGSFSEEKAYEQTLVLLRNHPEVTALFCASDLMALGAIKAAKALGMDVPRNLSVIGFDDILLSSYSTPQLSTVGQNIFQLGYQAANLLIDMLEVKTKSHVCILDTELIARESTCKAQNDQD
ncbi:LacI family transcriptional regulator [Bacillus canaveralius]|uniref:LacI family transcriptional regulator n=1 Tax=Bacillus canaveralius TaxID=1403243 RepID=A0A2N5GRB5_9BACI|nr:MULTISPECIES: LacI family DNA-binding transcriptional regulator [Bacillus]PLR84472.1 LacI family transcriptional regulator [Bacillus sp. V33-4]PLR85987.1 LacI family transcriptional regulator [Bacillus canaveralius]PLS00106.1 LacI family transcriptional regulator [Bacillus canaveralius]RSK53390.1 LacI family transcriptional regulator [Bacillus canaveralius]